jgi:tetratricopeptide (TPR) repeat protein
MSLKKAFLLWVAMLLLLFSFLNGAPDPQPFQDQEDTDAEKLIDKGSYCYGILEDYPLALKYLKRAVEVADTPSLKSQALIKTGYVFFLMGERVPLFKKYIHQALEADPSLELQSIYYKKRFVDIFKAVKKNPQVDEGTVEAIVLQPEPGAGPKGAKFYLKLNLDYLSASDSDYKDVYGSGFFSPSIKAGFRIARNVYIWTGFGLTSAKGTIPVEETSATSNQTFFSLGMRYSRDISKTLGYKVEASVVSISYREEALETEVKESAMGFDIQTGLVFNVGKSAFSEFSAGYMYASDMLTDKKVLLGGFHAGLGVGLRF